MTPLTQQVTSLEWSRTLRDLGVRQTALWSWVGNQLVYTPNKYDILNNPNASAFSVAELGLLLGKAKSVDVMQAYGHVMNVPDTHVITEIGLLYCMTNPDVAAQMLAYLIKNKLITLV